MSVRIIESTKRRLRWLFNIYRVAYGKPMHGPQEPQWLVTVCGRRFVVRYCAMAEGGW